jgi:hypothetical protein
MDTDMDTDVNIDMDTDTDGDMDMGNLKSFIQKGRLLKVLLFKT